MGGILTDITAAQGTLTDLHTEAETGNEATKIAETGIEADLATDDFLRLTATVPHIFVLSCLQFSTYMYDCSLCTAACVQVWIHY